MIELQSTAVVRSSTRQTLYDSGPLHQKEATKFKQLENKGETESEEEGTETANFAEKIGQSHQQFLLLDVRQIVVLSFESEVEKALLTILQRVRQTQDSGQVRRFHHGLQFVVQVTIVLLVVSLMDCVLCFQVAQLETVWFPLSSMNRLPVFPVVAPFWALLLHRRQVGSALNASGIVVREVESTTIWKGIRLMTTGTGAVAVFDVLVANDVELACALSVVVLDVG